MELPLLGKLNRPLPWLLGLATVGIVLIGTTTYKVVQPPARGQKVEELTVPVQRQNLTVEIQASGTVEPGERVKISPKTSGRLAKLLVEQGDRVKRGQILALMDNDRVAAEKLQYQASLQQAIANLETSKINIPNEINQAQSRVIQAQANLNQAKQRTPAQVEQAKAQVQSAEARFKLAKERVKRYEYLFNQGADSRDKFDEAMNEFRTAEANLLEAQQRLQQTQNTVAPEIGQLEAAVMEAQTALKKLQENAGSQIAQLEAAKLGAEAQLKSAQIGVSDTVLSAPFDGIVTQKAATEGDIVSPSLGAGSSSIVELARGLEILAKVPEVDVGQLKIGQSVKIIADAYPEQVFQGKIKLIAPEAKVENNVTSFEVKIALVTGQDQLRSKMNVDVTFLGKQIDNALVVPTVAIVTEKGKTGVMVQDRENKPKFKPVTIGLTLGDKTQVLEGLAPEERVFIDLPQDPRMMRRN